MVIYNRIIPFSGYVALTIFPFIFARKRPLSGVDLNHEKIHLCQQFEVFISSLLLFCALVFIFAGSYWCLLLSVPVYYVLYGLEYFIRYLVYGSQKEAYRNISFEQEAYLHEGDLSYLDGRKPFGWLKYLTRKSYEE